MIPVFFVVVRRMLGDKLDEPSKEFLERQGEANTAHRPDRYGTGAATVAPPQVTTVGGHADTKKPRREPGLFHV
jgi:hypothetical protein